LNTACEQIGGVAKQGVGGCKSRDCSGRAVGRQSGRASLLINATLVQEDKSVPAGSVERTAEWNAV
jgi:hypothetical protein